MRIIRSGVACTALVTLLACQPPADTPTDTAADVAAVNAVRQAEVAAILAGDTMMGYAADDVVVMPPNEPQVTGIAAARAWFGRFMGMMTVESLSYDPTQITVAGDRAIEHYTGSLTVKPKAGGAAMTERVKGLHIYRRGADGTWKMTHDVWNSDAAPPAGM